MDPATHDLPLGDGRSMHLRITGSGEDIVLIHGALTTGRDWLGPPIDALKGLGRTIILDRPGHGGSRRRRFEAGPHGQAAQIRTALAELGAAKPLLVAHSLGAAVALAFAARFPDCLSGLVLVAPLMFPESRPLERALYGPRALPGLGPAFSSFMAKGPDRTILEQMHRLMFFPQPRPAYWEANYPWAWMLSAEAGVANGEEFAVMHPWTLDSPRPDAVGAPVSILFGDKDAIVRPAGQGLALADMVPGAIVTRLGDAGHMIHHTHPEALRAAVEACRELAAQPA